MAEELKQVKAALAEMKQPCLGIAQTVQCPGRAKPSAVRMPQSPEGFSASRSSTSTRRQPGSSFIRDQSQEQQSWESPSPESTRTQPEGWIMFNPSAAAGMAGAQLAAVAAAAGAAAAAAAAVAAAVGV